MNTKLVEAWITRGRPITMDGWGEAWVADEVKFRTKVKKVTATPKGYKSRNNGTKRLVASRKAGIHRPTVGLLAATHFRTKIEHSAEIDRMAEFVNNNQQSILNDRGEKSFVPSSDHVAFVSFIKLLNPALFKESS